MQVWIEWIGRTDRSVKHAHQLQRTGSNDGRWNTYTALPALPFAVVVEPWKHACTALHATPACRVTLVLRWIMYHFSIHTHFFSFIF